VKGSLLVIAWSWETVDYIGESGRFEGEPLDYWLRRQELNDTDNLVTMMVF
jgi:hypothetical protein